jgi:hypothetical protein
VGQQHHTDKPPKLAGELMQRNEAFMPDAQTKFDGTKGGGCAEKQSAERGMAHVLSPQGACRPKGHQYNQKF